MSDGLMGELRVIEHCNLVDEEGNVVGILDDEWCKKLGVGPGDRIELWHVEAMERAGPQLYKTSKESK